MPDPVSALHGESFTGFATVREIGSLGMISLRAKPDALGLKSAVMHCIGTEIPDERRILQSGERAVGWMSPDEYLLILPYAETTAALSTIAEHMAGSHHLATTVSDARTVFRVEGAMADQVLAKLAPVDLVTLPPGELRRTRVAQVAAAFWREGDGFTLICFRSVARYVYDLLSVSARLGSERTQR